MFAALTALTAFDVQHIVGEDWLSREHCSLCVYVAALVHSMVVSDSKASRGVRRYLSQIRAK